MFDGRDVMATVVETPAATESTWKPYRLTVRQLLAMIDARVNAWVDAWIRSA